MKVLKQIWSFLRWRLIAVRYLTRLTSTNGWDVTEADLPQVSTNSEEIEEKGFMAGPVLPKETINQILNLYKSRIESVIPKETGHPFTNLIKSEDISINNPLIKIAFSKEILDTAIAYFGGKVTLDTIQFLYSWPTHGQLRASQQWHKDFGDTKSLHAIFYLNDVLDLKAGPFTFIDKKDTQKIGKSPFIRRIPDQDFLRELGNGEIKYFYGEAGNSVIVDPAACYHYGSRCETPRLAIFITFNTPKPFVAAQDLIKNNAVKLFRIASELRPDLSKSFLAGMLNIKNTDLSQDNSINTNTSVLSV